MSARAFVLAVGVLAVVCAAAALGMRASLTHYGSDPEALSGLEYKPAPGTEGMLSLYTEKDVIQAMEERGMDVTSHTLEEMQAINAMAFDNVEDIAPVIVTGTFTGAREYAWRAFRCEVKVGEVLKGEGIASGDVISVFDPFMIVEPNSTGETGEFSSERIVTRSLGDYGTGMTPMREGQEYLLFLVPKSYPAEWDPSSYVQTYELADHPYARIATDVTDAEGRVGVIDLDALPVERRGDVEFTIMPRLPLAEACERDVFVQSERAGEIYLATCGAILDRVLGERG